MFHKAKRSEDMHTSLQRHCEIPEDALEPKLDHLVALVSQNDRVFLAVYRVEVELQPSRVWPHRSEARLIIGLPRDGGHNVPV